MSLSRSIALSLLLACAEARFGQEQVPVQAVSDLGAAGFGEPGVAATIAGSIPSSLLAAASPCDKLMIADQMITELGNDQQVIDAAKGLVAAETNFNPFAVDVPFVCADPTLPATEALRGITPLVDPAVDGAETANAASEQSLTTPFDATGLSQADVLLAQGFSAFTPTDADGQEVQLDGQDGANNAGDDNAEDNNDNADNNDIGNGDGGNVNDGNVNNGNMGGNNGTVGDDGNNDGVDNNQGNGNEDNNNVNDGSGCNVGNGNNNNNNANDDAEDDQAEDDAAEDDANNDDANDDAANDDAADDDNADGAVDGGNANLDFGICQPTMAFIGGLNGRPDDEFTFIPQDPLVAEGQQEALNPNIITNRICDQLTNVCEASPEAVAACEDAQAEIEALGTRDQSTADTWNALLGFAGADTSVEVV